MIFMFMNHRSVTDSAYIEYNVTVDTRQDLTPVEPYWLDVEKCGTDPVYDVPWGAARGALSTRGRWSGAAEGRPARGRLAATSTVVARHCALRRPDCPNDEIYTSRPIWGSKNHPFYKVRPVLHEPGPIHMTSFHSASGARSRRVKRSCWSPLRREPATHARDGDHGRVPSRPDPSVTEPCGALPERLRRPEEAEGADAAAAVPRADRGRRGGKAVNIDAPPGRRVVARRGRHRGGRRPVLQAPQRVLCAPAGPLTWRFHGPTVHNVTLANGPRGFASPNLSEGAPTGRSSRVPGTYRSSAPSTPST